MTSTNPFEDLINLQNKIDDISSNILDVDGFLHFLTNQTKYLQEKLLAIQLFSSIDTYTLSRPAGLSKYKTLIVTPPFQTALKLFSSRELHQIFTSLPLLLVLYKNGFIDIETIVERSVANFNEFMYFIYEIKDADRPHYRNIVPKLDNRVQIRQKLMVKEQHDELREIATNPSPLAEMVRNDDIDSFQLLVSQTNLSLASRIPYSFYAFCDNLNIYSNAPFLIEYAAFFGSIKIFKFLHMNKARYSENIMLYAIAGGNYDIIHLLEPSIAFNEDCLDIALKFHRNDIFRYIIENSALIPAVAQFINSIEFYNAELFVDLLPMGLKVGKTDEFYFKSFFTKQISFLILFLRR